MEKKEVVCDNCEAVCKITYDLDDMFFTVKYCPFCGEEMEVEDIVEDDDDLRDDDDSAFYRDEDEDHF